MPRERKEETMNAAWLDAKFAPVRENSHRAVMVVCRPELERDVRVAAFTAIMEGTIAAAVQIAAITAILEGTMAAAVEILGAEDAFNLIQPLVDRALNPALPGQD